MTHLDQISIVPKSHSSLHLVKSGILLCYFPVFICYCCFPIIDFLYIRLTRLALQGKSGHFTKVWSLTKKWGIIRLGKQINTAKCLRSAPLPLNSFVAKKREIWEHTGKCRKSCKKTKMGRESTFYVLGLVPASTSTGYSC
jgi:hypothetical protein